jgi:hypothetical protein
MNYGMSIEDRLAWRAAIDVANPRAHAVITGVTDAPDVPVEDNRIYGLAVLPYWWRWCKVGFWRVNLRFEPFRLLRPWCALRGHRGNVVRQPDRDVAQCRCGLWESPQQLLVSIRRRR